jgi:hypothetical protein
VLGLIISLITSATTIVSMYYAGNGKSWSWLLGLANQVVWWVFIFVYAAWGLIPLNIALIFIFTRNYLKWRKNESLAIR